MMHFVSTCVCAAFVGGAAVDDEWHCWKIKRKCGSVAALRP